MDVESPHLWGPGEGQGSNFSWGLCALFGEMCLLQRVLVRLPEHCTGKCWYLQNTSACIISLHPSEASCMLIVHITR